VKCYIFSIGERTTGLCRDLMKEYGFEVITCIDQSSLWEKLKWFYIEALKTEDYYFMRIDADIIPNQNVKRLTANKGWNCAQGYDWYSQDRKAMSVHVMERPIIEKCLEHIEEAKDQIRPETYLWRLPGINPYTSIEASFSCGLHGYGQKDHRERIKELKYNRNQEYDWKLLERIEAL
jgi:hypothetical protein